VEASLGNGRKEPAASELKNMAAARKSVVSTRLISRGERLTRENVAIKRPGDGMPPGDLDKVLGLPVTSDIDAGTGITWKDLK
jgi:sialic acid synthase SpsE